MTKSYYAGLCASFLLLFTPLSGSHAEETGGAAAASGNLPVVSGGHYEEFKSSICNNNADQCAVKFALVPTGKNLIISHVACRLFLNPIVPAYSYVLTDTNRFGRDMQLTPVLLGAANNSGYFNSSNPVTKIYRAGERPQVFLGLLANPSEIRMDCIIAGQLL